MAFDGEGVLYAIGFCCFVFAVLCAYIIYGNVQEEKETYYKYK